MVWIEQIMLSTKAGARLRETETERKQDGNKKGADDAVEHRDDYRFLVGIAQDHGERGVLTGGSGRSNAGIGVEVCSQKGDDHKGEDLSHQVAEKGDASQFWPAGFANDRACQAIPPHAAGDRRAV